MFEQLFLDLYECDINIIDSTEEIQKKAHECVRSLGAEIVEECVHKFEPIGVSYIAVITTSHFSVHTWPEYSYCAVDIFSCNGSVPQKLAELIKKSFGAKKMDISRINRHIKGGNHGIQHWQ